MLGAFLGLVYCLTYFLINSGYAVRAFDETVNPLFRGRIVWERVTWGPLPWRIRVLGARIVDGDNRTLCSAKEVRASVDLKALLDFKIFAKDIEVNDAEVKVVVGAEPDPVYGFDVTTVNLAQVFLPPGQPYDDGERGVVPHLRFTSATVRNAHVTVDVGTAWLDHTGVDVLGGRFELTPEGLLKMGAYQIDAERVDLRVAKTEDPTPVHRRPLDSVYRWIIERVSARGIDWVGLAFDVKEFRGQVQGDTVKAEAFHMDLDRPGLPYVKARGTFDTDDISRQMITVDAPAFTGPVKARFEGEGDLFSVKGTFSMEGRRLGLDDWQTGAWDLKGRALNNTLFFDEGNFEAYGGQIGFTGALIGEEGTIHGRLDVDNVHLERLPQGPGEAFAGPLRGLVGIQLRGLFDELWLGADARLWLDRFTGAPDIAGLPLGRKIFAAVSAQMFRDEITVTQLDVDSAHADVWSSGTLDLAASTLDFRARLRSPEVRPLALGLGLDARGSLTVNGTITGALVDPTISLRAKSPALDYTPTPDLPFKRVGLDARLTYGQGLLTLKEASARLAGGRIVASGTVGVGDDRIPLRLSARLKQIRAEDLPLPLSADVRGVLTGKVKLTGPARRPAVDGRLAIARPRWNRLAFTALVLDGRYSGNQVKVRALSVVDGQRTLVKGSGGLDLRKETFDLDLHLNAASLELINKVVDTPVPIRGTVTMDFTGGGTFKDPKGGGTLVLEDVVYGVPPEQDAFELEWSAELNVTADNRQLTLDGSLSEGIELRADVPLYPDGPPTTAEITFDELSPDDPLLRNFIPPLDEEVFTEPPVLTGRINATGDAWSGALYEADLTLDTLRTSIQDQVFESEKAVQLVYRDNQIKVKRLSLVAAGQRLEISGGADLDGFLDLQLTGEVDLEQLHIFLLDTFNSMRGLAWLDLRITGPFEDPMPSGVLTLTDAYLTPKRSLIAREIELLQPVDVTVAGLFGPNPTPGNFAITLPDRRVAVDPGAGEERPLNRVVMRRDDGEVYVKGIELVFANYAPQSLVIKADGDNLTFNVPDTTRGTTNVADLQFELIDMDRPQLTRMTLAGDFYLVRAEYVADVYSTSEISQGVTDNLFGRARRRSVSAFERIPLLKRMEVDLLINGDNDIFVRNQVATLALDMEIQPVDVHLTGNLFSDLNIDGQVLVITDDSTITFSGRAFEVIEGLVNFDGDNFLETNMRAQRNFEFRESSFQNVGSILGPAGGELDEELVTLIFSLVMPTPSSDFKPDIKFESSSGAPQIDVLSLVLTGRRIADLNADAAAQPALEVALSPLLSYFERPLEETLELDLSVVPQTTGTVEVDVDKKLGQRVRLFTRAQVGNDDVGNQLILGAEYQLNNVTFGELTNARIGLQNSTTARLRFRWTLD